MKKITLLLGLLFIFACNSNKRIEKTIANGNYDYAIKLATKKLKTNKDKKGKEKFIKSLKNAYFKAVDKDYRDLVRFKADTNPASIEQVYETYVSLDKRQEALRSILPLHLNGKEVDFRFTDYTNDIITSKKTLSDYLYNNAINLLNSNHKLNARKAYEELEYLDRINPNYKNLTSLFNEAKFKGTDFIEVQLINDSQTIIPSRLEEDLLDFNAYDINSFWTNFHINKDPKITYNKKLEILFRNIEVSPERITERQLIREREIKDGFEYVLDQNGNVAVDSLGNGIKVDKFITVTCNLFEITQEKASRILADVILTDLEKNQKAEDFPIDSEFVFTHIFGEADGDARALSKEDKDLIKLREIPFPSNEQMVFDTGEDIKYQLKNIIKRMEFE
jgi:hypothetical protein